MIRTTLIPVSGKVSILIPENDIGKPIKILAFAKDKGF
jgi:hypothetical protein